MSRFFERARVHRRCDRRWQPEPKSTSSDRVAEVWSALRDIASRHVTGISDYVAAYHPQRGSIDPLRQYDQIRKVPRDAGVVTYCRGPFCAYACEAVRALESEGIPARRLEEGFPERRRAGLPVETGAPVTA